MKKTKIFTKNITVPATNNTTNLDFGNVTVYATLQCDLATMKQSIRLEIDYSREDYERVIKNIPVRKIFKTSNCLDFVEDMFGFDVSDISEILADIRKVAADKANVEMVKETATATDIYECLKIFIYEHKDSTSTLDNGKKVESVYFKDGYAHVCSACMDKFIKTEGASLNCNRKTILEALKNKEVLISKERNDVLVSRKSNKYRCCIIKL